MNNILSLQNEWFLLTCSCIWFIFHSLSASYKLVVDLFPYPTSLGSSNQGTLNRELSRTLPTPFFVLLDTYQKIFLPNYLQADKVLGKSE